MSLVEILNTLAQLDWEIRKDEVGDFSATQKFSDRIVSIIPDIRDLGKEKNLTAMLSLSTDSFTKAYNFIGPDKNGEPPLIRAKSGLSIKSSLINETHVHQLSDQTLKWGKEQDIEGAILEHSILPTSAKGAQPIWHLSALALLHDVQTLRSYQESFGSGDRLGFVPYITKDMIDRSLQLAENSEY